MTTTTAIDPTALVAAIQNHDSSALAATYATDAVIHIVDRDHPPANPQVLSGRAEIEAYYRDVCGRNLDHTVPTIVASDTVLAFEQNCRYPDGVTVTCVTVATVRDGLITRQTIAQAWD